MNTAPDREPGVSTGPRSAPSGPRRWVVLLFALLVVVALIAWRHWDFSSVLTLDQLKASRDLLQAHVSREPWTMAAGYFVVYVVATALSIPGAVILTLAGGAMFGFLGGLALVSFASSLGALLAFLTARYLLRAPIQARLGARLAPINEGMQRDGALYLLSLRLVPLFPFWLINLLMGLTTIPAWRFYAVSQLGMLAGTAVYVNAGTQLGALQAVGDIVSPTLLLSFCVLGLFPLMAKSVAKSAMAQLARRRHYARWQRPRHFDRNLIVIGAGAGGLVSAYIASSARAQVSLIEAERMGGDCLNHGCVPSKTLIRAAQVAKHRHTAQAVLNFPAVMARVREVIRAIEPHDAVARYQSLGVDVIQGRAQVLDPWTVAITHADGSTRRLTARSLLIATGASPIVPEIEGLAPGVCLTSDTLWHLTELPRRLVVLGGGPIGCEMAQSFARLGSQVTLIEAGSRLLAREDPDVSALVAASLVADGVTVLTGFRVQRATQLAGEQHLELVGTTAATGEHDPAKSATPLIPFDVLLGAMGRRARVTGFGLEALGLALTTSGTLATNAFLQTSLPNIYAVGDVTGPFQLTHAAAHQAWYAAVNALFGRWHRFAADYRVVPRVTFTDPEVAHVGLSETEAQAQAIAYERTRYALDDLDRAIIDGTTQGWVQVLTVPGKDRILGVTIVGAHAGELIAEYVLAMRHGLGLNRILATIHAYPTLVEANKYAAGAWKRSHLPERWLALLPRYHAWERRR